eukprot:gb/GEZN01009059.1/.p1 GENE.gb/GEZN01009059.1/~~gb/GEZN01009059.1/.p1  ORF type:complete len:375 (-),score=43.08 gb/GEZN01009059.1/:81-1205(-)
MGMQERHHQAQAEAKTREVKVGKLPKNSPQPVRLLPNPHLHQALVTSIMNACAYYDSDLLVFKSVFVQHADVVVADNTKLISPDALIRLLRNLGVDVGSSTSAQQYVRAFDASGDGRICLSEMVLGLMVMDPELPHDPGDKWLQLRTDMVFAFYDLDGDGLLSMSEFLTFLAHLLRAEGRMYDRATVHACGSKLSQHLPRGTHLDRSQFLTLLSSGLIEQGGLQPRLLFCAPPFRQRVKGSVLKRDFRLKPIIKQSWELAPSRNKTVRFSLDGMEGESLRNVTLIEREGLSRQLVEQLRCHHHHSKRVLSSSRKIWIEMLVEKGKAADRILFVESAPLKLGEVRLDVDWFSPLARTVPAKPTPSYVGIVRSLSL